MWNQLEKFLGYSCGVFHILFASCTVLVLSENAKIRRCGFVSLNKFQSCLRCFPRRACSSLCVLSSNRCTVTAFSVLRFGASVLGSRNSMRRGVSCTVAYLIRNVVCLPPAIPVCVLTWQIVKLKINNYLNKRTLWCVLDS